MAVEVAELADDGHPGCFLRFDELPVKECNQRFAPAGFQRVLPELDDRRGRAERGFVSSKMHGFFQNRVIVLFVKQTGCPVLSI
ncbi:hypothetical protein RFM26_25090 [Mesorhizobium sp. VK23B]|uniref:Uncharacterized protein n=1 Tax=Mesorhizobium dulcispinae TaxID=3072316 RepID=A0ABU4XLT9_9HYPH|nr:hypothetical protein [Mesorhizobium sp. VK23B]MDX8475221.1 hypothetical protein [Mesorhizobium sp. VK23A]